MNKLIATVLLICVLAGCENKGQAVSNNDVEALREENQALLAQVNVQTKRINQLQTSFKDLINAQKRFATESSKYAGENRARVAQLEADFDKHTDYANKQFQSIIDILR